MYGVQLTNSRGVSLINPGKLSRSSTPSMRYLEGFRPSTPAYLPALKPLWCSPGGRSWPES